MKKFVKLCCGHEVETVVEPRGETAWCPICKRDLFTGWPSHMTRNIETAERLKVAASKYLDSCAKTGSQPTLAALVTACEPIVTGRAFAAGRSVGSAIDDD